MINAESILEQDVHPSVETLQQRRPRYGRQIIAGKTIVVIPDYQIKLGPGEAWHRRGGIEDETACGVPIPPTSTHAFRGFTLDDQICNDCFTKHELVLGRRAAWDAEEERFEESARRPFDPAAPPRPRGQR